MSDLPVPDHYDEKQVAFELWAYLARRNAAETARLMREIPGDGEDSDRPAYPHISARTIRDWANRYHWAERFDRDMRTIAPGIHNRVHQEIMIGSVQAIDVVRKMVTGEIEADKVQLDAAKTLLDRAGHLPWTRPPDNDRPTGPTVDYAQSVVGKSMEELGRMLGFAIDTGDDSSD